ncbi:MAG: LPS assembly protein LptD [Pseudomonadota bacterium]
MRRHFSIAPLLITSCLYSGGEAIASSAITVTAVQDSDPALFGVDDDIEETDEVLFEADTVSRDTEDGPIVAEGNVRAFFGERYLHADRLTYNPATDVVTAEGNVSITDADLQTVFAGRVVLSGDLRDGVVENFSALLEDNARIAAARGVQEQGARTKLNRAVYTACNVCNSDGEAKTPTWRIKSLRVTRDLERKVVRFHHAFFELKGVPILYTPFLQGPDPSVERQSGFLTPRVGASSRQGFNFELPYYLAISNSQDATFHPRFTSEDGVLWQGEYRLRRKRGYHVLQGGVIDFDNTGLGEDDDDDIPLNEEDIPGVRWHYFGRGYEEFGNNWRASYDIERVSDDIYLREYNIERRGDLRQELERGRTNQLRSNARLARATSNSRLTIDTYLFQGLLPGDDASTTPYILPLINFDRRLGRFGGGEFTVTGNLASIYRIEGIDSQRFTAAANWGRDLITPGGHRFQLFAELRADAYYFQDLDEGTETLPGIEGADSRFEGRLAPTVGIEWSYPLTRDFFGGRLVLEPRVQLLASPTSQNEDIINEDSQSIEFDYAGLFEFNKSTGFDSFEDGQRANFGFAANADWANGVTLEAAVGRQYRLQETDAFDFIPDSVDPDDVLEFTAGLGDTASDIVGNLNFRYRNHFGFENRFRINTEEPDVARAESMAFFRAGPVRGNVTYVRLSEENAAANLIKREELTAGGRVSFTRNWYAGGAWRLDLVNNTTIRQDFTVGYQDECSTFAVTYRRDRTSTDNLEPDNAFLLTFSLRSLVQ